MIYGTVTKGHTALQTSWDFMDHYHTHGSWIKHDFAIKCPSSSDMHG